MIRVRPALTAADAPSAGQLSLVVVNKWMNELHAIPYGFSHQWKTPAEVKSTSVADCKGKAIALFHEMRANGARNLYLVIGKRQLDARSTHAWLEWQTKDGVYVLDPTFNWFATKSTEYNPMTYVPLYAYDGTRKYRAADPVFIARNRFGVTPTAPAEFVLSHEKQKKQSVSPNLPLQFRTSPSVLKQKYHSVRKC